MPAVSEEELQQLREDNEKLREKIAEANSKRVDNEAARNREIEAMQLAAENTRLQAQLARAQEAAKVSNTRDGAANVIEATKAQLAQATAVAEQPAGPVDTNASRSGSGNGNGNSTDTNGGK